MSDGIYLIQDRKLVRMEESPYATEELLQNLLSQYPDLLAGDQMGENEPRKWLLIQQEMGVPDDDGASDRWALDHLFLDQDGIPTLVEVKRSTDSRIRREVVGQMLDYGANAVVYWPVETLRARFNAQCEQKGVLPDEVLTTAFGFETGPDEFWQKVKTNLQAGKIRMVFIADRIPRELKRIIEFLNNQMDPAQVLGVEIKQFTGQGLKTLVPRVIGLTEESESRKSPRTDGRTWDEVSFFKHMEEHCDGEDVKVAKKLYQWCCDKQLRIWWGRGQYLPGFVPVFDYGEQEQQLFELWGNAKFETAFQYLSYKPPFDDEQKRIEMLNRFNRIPGVELSPDSISRRPSIPLTVFRDESNYEGLIKILQWSMGEVAAYEDQLHQST